MFKFKKKEKVNAGTVIHDTIDVMVDSFIKLQKDNLDLIKDLSKTDKQIISIVCEQQKAIKNLEEQMKAMQELMNKAEES